MAAAGSNPLADIDWNSPDINALLSNLFGGTAPPPSSTSPPQGATPATSSSFAGFALPSSSTGFPPSATAGPSTTFAYPSQQLAQAPYADRKAPLASTAPPSTTAPSQFLPSDAGSAMRSTSPDDTFDSPSSSDDGDGPSAKLATKGATKRKSKASATGGGAAATHGATGVEGKKGRTSSASKADDGASRKSSSEPKEDSKVNKRKEQNRAAQRAFRERKEKHVKDLEDKVAELNAQSEGQKNENENLRDLLARLQKENVMLKQQAFTFSLPSGLGNPSSVPSNAIKPLSPPSSLKDAASASNSSSPESSGSSADSPAIQPVAQSAANASTPWSFGSTPSSDDSPASLFAIVPGPDTPPSTLAFSSTGFNAFTAPNAGDLRQPSTADAPAPAVAPSPVSFAFSPGDFFPPPSPAAPLQPQQQQQQQAQAPPASPFQMLATNPLFTSFNASSPGYSLPQSIASPPSSQLADLFPNGFDDFLKYSTALTGGSGLTPGASAADYAMSPEMLSLLNYPSSSGDSSFGASTANGDGGNTSNASPLSSLTSPPSSTGASPAAGNADHDKHTCPSTREGYLALVADAGESTFGSASPDDAMAVAAAAAIAPVAADSAATPAYTYDPSAPRDANFIPIWARTDPKERDLFFRDHIMLSADPAAKNVKLQQLWQQITSTPGYTPESFDLDGLCHEMKCKARCDGSGPVLDEEEARQILDEVPYRIRTNPMFGQLPSK